jgi:hypothetical protein
MYPRFESSYILAEDTALAQVPLVPRLEVQCVVVVDCFQALMYDWVPRLSRGIVPSSSLVHAVLATNYSVCECLDWGVSSTRRSHQGKLPTVSRVPVSSLSAHVPNPFLWVC